MSDNDEMVQKSTVEEAGAKGGRERAKRLPADERKRIGHLGAEARWHRNLPQATHSGILRIGDIQIPCAVLEDGTRVLTQEGFYKAIGRSGKPAAGRGSQVEKVAPFLDLDNLKPFVDKDLADSTKPVLFRVATGSRAYAYRAEQLPRVCEVYLKARDAGALLKTQMRFAKACDILMRGLAHVGIVALVDEATGYQDDRARDALARILEQFIAKELRNYIRVFPLDWFRELCRLRGIPFPEDMRLPPYFGKFVNNLVYCRLAPGVLEELQRKNPVMENGRRKNKNYNWLTENTGHPKLLQLLGSEVTLMRMSQEYEEFQKLVDKFHPPHKQLPLLDWAEKENH